MAILKSDGTLSGRIGNMVFQYQKGKQTMRERPSSYRDKKTVVQLAQREKMRKAQQLYRIVKDVVKGCFEFKKTHQRDCDSFMSANILDFGTMAQGSLPTLSCRFEEGHAVCDLIPDDWKEGDVLRFVSVEGEKVNSIDKTMGLPLPPTISQDVVNDGLYCWIHIRQGRKYAHVSTQKLCKNTATGTP